MKKVAIYGTGEVSDYFYSTHSFDDEELLYFVETEKNKDVFKNHKVICLNEIDSFIDTLYIANSYICTLLYSIKLGIPKDKITILNEPLYREYTEINNGILDVHYDRRFAEKYRIFASSRDNFPHYVMMRKMNNPIEIFNCDEIQDIMDRKCIISDDYCRYGTLRLLIEEILTHDIKGQIAELGVYKGEFAKFLNQMFKDRDLYLFDTFEGFNDKDIEIENNKKYTSMDWYDKWDNFKNTTVELVMSKMTYPDKCIIRKGYFPDTIPNEDVRFAFVSLDCDLYEPMIEGLRYFYPRLNKGGYIMIHDYNQYYYLKGVKQAVNEYECEINEIIPKVPITDICGTLVLCK